jgi:hypothetical protein
MTRVHYDPSVVRTLEAAVGRPAEAHSWVLTDTSTGTLKGIYASEAIAVASLTKFARQLNAMVTNVTYTDTTDD